jgi:hypothetical protein
MKLRHLAAVVSPAVLLLVACGGESGTTPVAQSSSSSAAASTPASSSPATPSSTSEQDPLLDPQTSYALEVVGEAPASTFDWMNSHIPMLVTLGNDHCALGFDLDRPIGQLMADPSFPGSRDEAGVIALHVGIAANHHLC